jgi:putative ABC transport system substrate-binding protein
MKNTLRKFVVAALAAVILVGCAKKEDVQTGTAPGTAKTYNIGFVQLIDNLTFKEMRDGFYVRMAERGYGPDRALITYKDAQGDTGSLNTIVQEFANGKYDMVATLATPATQAFVNLESKTPAVFISVADPLAAGVVTSMEKPDKNATGTSNYIPVDALFQLADRLTPGIKRYGFIYNFGEVNAVSTIKKAKEYLDSRGVAYQEVTVGNSSEVQQAAQSLAGRVDAIFIPNDSMVVSAMAQVVSIAEEAKIPVYGTALVHVVNGALATVGIDDRLIGSRSADMVVDYLEGKNIADMPVVFFDTLYTVINERTAAAIGLEIPAEFADATRVGN